jgi:hypothetical protein
MCTLARTQNCQRNRCTFIIVIGDSEIIINHMVKKLVLRNNSIASILDRIRQLGGSLTDIIFYHILREHNKEMDWWENASSEQKEGELMVNGV